MDQVLAFLGEAYALAQTGFDGVNQVAGLIIALIAAVLMSGWRQLWRTALGAAVVHVVVGALLPVLQGGDFRLPEMLALPFWLMLLALFIGYAVVIAVFFFVKTLLTRGGGH